VKDTGCSHAFGGGLLTTVKGVGKSTVIALQDRASQGTQFEIVFSYPFTNGGSWELYATSDGVHFNTLAGGNYPLDAADVRTAKSATSGR